MKSVRPAAGLLAALLAYAAASLAHHVHNAEFLADYPGMPAWLSRTGVHAAWVGATSVGVLGYILVRRDRLLAGLSLIAIYAAYGFDALAHYWLAPAAAHTMAMNLTIALEVATAGLLLTVVFWKSIRAALSFRAP